MHLSLVARAGDDPRRQVPEPLKAWESWALWEDKERDCPSPYSDAKKHLCFWPSRLELRADKTGGQFDLAVAVFAETWVPLPGNTEAWPREVKANDAVLPVVEHRGAPAVHLNAGTYHLAGSYSWTSVPQRIAIPREIGILALVVDGQPVEQPVWDTQGFLWLQRNVSTETAERNSLTTKIYTQLADGIPLWLHMQIELTVSGKSREEQIGNILPEGWKLSAVDNPIPAIVDDQGMMKAQVRPGRWVINVDAFRLDNPKDIRFAPGVKPAVGDELVAFAAQPDFRTVEITGMPVVDASQTTLPPPWRDLPVYRWNTSTAFHLEERMRGMGQQKPEGLRIARDLWLDENGQALTFRDRITGKSQEVWRLDAAAGQDLGSVRIGNEGQLITRNAASGAPGVEIRTRYLELEATGRMARKAEFPATGWRTDADQLTATLNLPPGWRLFALFGADWVRGDWLTAWTLLDLFVVLVFSLAVFRLWGIGAALLAFVGFGLSYHEPGSPRYVWLLLLVPLALQRVVANGWGRRLVTALKGIAVLCFLLVLVPFLARQIQQALYPQLEVVSDHRWSPFGRSTATYSTAPAERGGPSTMKQLAPEETGPSSAPGGADALRRKLDRIIIPKLEFRDATVPEAIDFLKKKSVELDDLSPPGAGGVNIVLKPDSGLEPTTSQLPGASNNPLDTRITVSLTNIPLGEALKYVTGLANLKYKIEPHGVSIVPLSGATDVLVTKEWKIPPELIPGGAAGTKDWLIANGITFSGAASAVYVPKSSRLIVRNTEDQLDLVNQIVSAGAREEPAPAAAAATSPVQSSARQGNLEYDARARIQTGPGVPEWNWRAVQFGWNGPVAAVQQVKPVLISLALERGLTALRVALLLLLAAIMLGVRKIGGTATGAGGKAAAVVIFAMTLAHATAQMPIPDNATLDKLRERLLEASDAYPNAAEIPSATLTLNDRKMVMDVEVHAAIRTAVPLPGRLPGWSPVAVTLDDHPEAALRREDGYLWLLVDAGVHHVHVEGSLATMADWEWTFVLKPHQVKVETAGWTYAGVKPDGTPEAQVVFTRKQKATADQSSYESQEVTPIAVVERHVELGLIWQVHTKVVRLSPMGKAVVLRIPLLPGETVLSDAMVKDGVIQAPLGAKEQVFTWDSSLEVANNLKLATRADDRWVERWYLLASPVWDVTLTGLAPVFEAQYPELVPVWRPWPGESTELAVNRPEAIAGATVTVSHGSLETNLGKRQRTSQLELTLRCSLGEDFLVEVPAEAEITSLLLDQNQIPVRKAAGKIIVPVHPGEDTVAIAWKRNVPLETRALTDEARLPVESANITTSMTLPEDRWVLWAYGPQRGPAVRFWIILLCSLLAAIVLGRLAQSPLRTIEWMLLAIGLTQISLLSALIVIGWLFFLVWRRSEGFQKMGNWRYNSVQILLIVMTLAALGILISAVGEGLLGKPEMFIIGNGSTPSSLTWFQARSGPDLPRGGGFSISLWWYRLIMLLWALWLASALLRWLRKGWESFTTGGVFHRQPKAGKVVPPPMPAQG